jgi:hypothetical protein
VANDGEGKLMWPPSGHRYVLTEITSRFPQSLQLNIVTVLRNATFPVRDSLAFLLTGPHIFWGTECVIKQVDSAGTSRLHNHIILPSECTAMLEDHIIDGSGCRYSAGCEDVAQRGRGGEALARNQRKLNLS